MIIDRNKILKYRDIKAIRRILEVMYCEAVPRTPCRQCTKRREFLSDQGEIEIQVKQSRISSRVIGFLPMYGKATCDSSTFIPIKCNFRRQKKKTGRSDLKIDIESTKEFMKNCSTSLKKYETQISAFRDTADEKNACDPLIKRYNYTQKRNFISYLLSACFLPHTTDLNAHIKTDVCPRKKVE